MNEKKYKQTEIPSIRTKGVPKKDRAKFVKEYYHFFFPKAPAKALQTT